MATKKISDLDPILNISTSDVLPIVDLSELVTKRINLLQIFSNFVDTDGTLSGNSDVKYASQKATKTYADTKLTSYLSDRAPLTTDVDFQIGSLWIDQTEDNAYILIEVTGGVATWEALTYTPLIFKGSISVNTDFPLIANVRTGWFYVIEADVTDNAGATYTNTGQSFILGSEIIWNGTNWTESGNVRIWSDNGSLITLINDGTRSLQITNLKALTLDTNVAAAGVTLSGTTLSADGTDAAIDINITPKGTGEVNLPKVDIDSGTIDGATIATSDITVGAGKVLNVSAGTLTLADNQISGDKVEGGTINAVTINTLTSTSVLGNTFDTNVTAAGVTLSGVTLSADGTDPDIDINITPKGTGEVNITKVDINGGTIDGATIETSNITVGADKTLNVSAGTLTLADNQISGDKVEGGTINAVTINTLTGTTANITTFDTNVAEAGVTLSGTTLSADGSNENIDINITPKGTGEVNISKVDIDNGTIDGTDITVGAGKTLNISAGTLTLADNQISGDKVEGGTINEITINNLITTSMIIDGVRTNIDNDGLNISGITISADGTNADINIDIIPQGTGEVNIPKVDINSGTIDGATIATSDITVGAGKTLNVSAGTLTLADNQISGDKVEGGTINEITINTLINTNLFIDELNTNIDVDGLNISGITIAADGTNADINIDIIPQGTGEVNLPKVDIDSGTIDGTTIATSDITVGAGKTLNVSAGTLTLADNQISGDKVEGGTINAVTITTLTSTSVLGTTFDTNVAAAGVTLSGVTLSADGTDENINIDITPKGTGEVNLPKVDIDGGTIDNTIIGDTTQAAVYGTNIGVSEGLLSDPTIADVGSNKISITSVDVAIRSDANWGQADNKLYVKTVPANLELSVTDNSVNYIYVTWNSGSPIYAATTDRSIMNNSNAIPVSRIYMSSSALITQLDYDFIGRGKDSRNFDRVMRIRGSGGIEKESGLAITETATRVVNVASGYSWFGLKRITLDACAQGDGSTTSKLWYHSSGNWTSADATDYNNTQYDNGTNLATLTNTTRFAVNWIFRCVTSKCISIVLGTGDYTSAQAEASSMPAIPDLISNFYVLIGRIIVRKSDSTAYAIELVGEKTFTTGAVSTHNDLGGLQGGTTGEYYHLTSAQAAGSAESDFLVSGSSPFAWARKTLADTKALLHAEPGVIGGTTPAAGNFTISSIKGSTGGFLKGFSEATANITASASISIEVNIPATSKIIGCQLRVDSALADGELWDAAYSGGSSDAICSGQAVAQNTKFNSLTTATISSEADIAITKNGGGSFTAQGTIRAIVYYEHFTSMASL